MQYEYFIQKLAIQQNCLQFVNDNKRSSRCSLNHVVVCFANDAKNCVGYKKNVIDIHDLV